MASDSPHPPEPESAASRFSAESNPTGPVVAATWYQAAWRQSQIAWRDQKAVAITLAILIAAVGVWLTWHQFFSPQVEIDQAPLQEARFQLDLNSATWAELAALPGIGEQLARAIVSHRQQCGPFQQHQELLRIKGIGPAKLKAVQPYLAPLDEGVAAGTSHAD